MGPLGWVVYKPVFDRIEPAIPGVVGEIRLVADVVFAMSSLPDTVFVAAASLAAPATP